LQEPAPINEQFELVEQLQVPEPINERAEFKQLQ
jgi:hypothetical protein